MDENGFSAASRRNAEKNRLSLPERMEPVNSEIIPSGPKWRRWVLVILAFWMLAVTALILIATWENPRQRAVILMACGLILIWVVAGGFVMWRWRKKIAARIQNAPGPWWLKFIVACTLLALVEEAITTAMTNSAPLFGVRTGEAYITASANYLDVVLYHSVVMFFPMFIGWAFLLRFWRFSPFAVFILFGITGLLAETMSFGPQNLGNAGMWIFVYGLMVWLPAFSLSPHPKARPPRWWHYPMAVIIPILFVPLAAVTSPWLWLTPAHPSIHFPPIE